MTAAQIRRKARKILEAHDLTNEGRQGLTA